MDASSFIVEVAFYHLSLAEQCSLLNLADKAESHYVEYIRLLINAARMIGCHCLDEQAVILANAKNILPVYVYSQLQLESHLIANRLPSRITFVLGMHRSGTSAVSGLLDRLGLDNPKDLIEPNEANPAGYWESWSIYVANESLLSDLGSSWDSTPGLPRGWEASERAQRWRQSLLKKLIEIFPNACHALLKDPRFCIIGTGLEPWLQSNMAEFTFVLTLRHPYEVAQSLCLRDGLPFETAIRLWIIHVFMSEQLSRPFKRILVSFDQLIQEPSIVEEKIMEFIIHDDPSLDRKTTGPSNDLIQQDLHRHKLEDIATYVHEESSSIPTERSIALTLFTTLSSNRLTNKSVIDSIDRLRSLWQMVSLPPC